VKGEKHTQFAKEENMRAFFASAKQGDQVGQIFHRLAADLAGVVLPKSELESASVSAPVKATIVNHAQHDPAVEQLVLNTKKTDGKCIIQ